MLENGLMHLYKVFQFNVINASTMYVIKIIKVKQNLVISNFPMRKSLDVSSSIASNSMVASNKQRHQHNNLATIRRQKLKGAHKHSKSM